MDKPILAATKQQCANKEQPKSVDETIDKLSEMFIEMLPESADFKEFEETMLEFGNEVVRRALKKNSK